MSDPKQTNPKVKPPVLVVPKAELLKGKMFPSTVNQAKEYLSSALIDKFSDGYEFVSVCRYDVTGVATEMFIFKLVKPNVAESSKTISAKK